MFFKSHLLELLSEKLFEIEHPIASALSMPIAIFVLFLSLLWSVSAVGRHGIIPVIALVVCFVIMNILRDKVSNGVIYVWIQPFICYAELIFIKYVFVANDEDTGVGLVGWFVFAALTLILFAYSAYSLDLIDSAWGFTYFVPYSTAWILMVKHQQYVYYIVVYLLLCAVIISGYAFIRKRRNEKYEIAEGSFFAGLVVVALTVVALLHADNGALRYTPIDFAVNLLKMGEV